MYMYNMHAHVTLQFCSAVPVGMVGVGALSEEGVGALSEEGVEVCHVSCQQSLLLAA